MFKDYHIILVPKDKNRTKTFKVSGLTLKILLFTFVLSIPLFFVAVLSTIHYQNKVIALKRNNYENRKLIENKNELILKVAKLEKSLSIMDDSIAHLSELMDVDPQSLKFGTGPIADLDVTISNDFDEVFSIPGADAFIEDWVSNNGAITVNKFKRKMSKFNDEAAILNKKLEEIFSQNKDKINFVNATPNMMPVEGWITSEFGIRKHPIGRRYRMHNGIDIASPHGTKIKAPAGGKVVFAARSSGYGNMLIIRHGYGISTMYAHLNNFYVKKGQTIKRGDIVAEIGTTGYSTGPHLHYEVQVDGIPSDPLVFLIH